MDHKTLATILFRVFGLAYLVSGVFTAPYLLFTASYDGTVIATTLNLLTYAVTGIFLFVLSKPFAALVMMGLGRENVLPPPPPRF